MFNLHRFPIIADIVCHPKGEPLLVELDHQNPDLEERAWRNVITSSGKCRVILCNRCLDEN